MEEAGFFAFLLALASMLLTHAQLFSFGTDDEIDVAVGAAEGAARRRWRTLALTQLAVTKLSTQDLIKARLAREEGRSDGGQSADTLDDSSGRDAPPSPVSLIILISADAAN